MIDRLSDGVFSLSSSLRFIDLFAGLGGFHQALEKLGHHCVFASEIDSDLATLYKKNFGIKPFGDIRKHHNDVPAHDILCAGFPCQPFSKAGEQLGFECPQWGDLFGYVEKILKRHKPRFLLIENVPNLLRHDDGRTWENVCKRLRAAGYSIDSTLLSPHMFGVPQIRDRVLIVGCRTGLADFGWPEAKPTSNKFGIKAILDVEPADARPLTEAAVRYITTWQALLDKLPAGEPLPSFPIWAMEFGANYPLRGRAANTPNRKKAPALQGSLGKSMGKLSKAEILAALPPYARSSKTQFPEWKIEFIEQNRAFYKKHKKVIDAWLPKIDGFAASFQKLEWNWKEGPRDLWKTIIQFRASGIRAKNPSAAPSLVALTTSQVPVISWERRYMTMRECARLQSMGELKHLPAIQTSAYKALGNAVNVEVATAVAKALIGVASKPRRNKARIKAKPAKEKYREPTRIDIREERISI